MNVDYNQRDLDDIDELRGLQREIEKLKAQLVALNIIKKFVMTIDMVINGDDVVERWDARSIRYDGVGMGIHLEEALRDWFHRFWSAKELCDSCAEFLKIKLEHEMSKGVCPICGSGKVRRVHYSTDHLDGEEVYFD